MMKSCLLYFLFLLEPTMCAIPPVDIPITVEILNASLLEMTNKIMEDVQKTVTATKALSIAALKQEIQTQQSLEEANNIKRFEEIQKQLKELETACGGKPCIPGVNPDVITSFIIPIFMGQMRCGNCFGCSGGDICFYYLFIYVIPLVTQNGGVTPINGTVPNTGSNQLNTLLQSLMGGLQGRGVTLPSLPGNLFPQQPNNLFPQQPGNLGNNNPLGALFNYIFSRRNGSSTNATSPAQLHGCCPPGPCPPPIPPIPPLPPLPPIDPYGPLPPDPYGPIPPVYGGLPQQAGVQTREFGTNYGRKY